MAGKGNERPRVRGRISSFESSFMERSQKSQPLGRLSQDPSTGGRSFRGLSKERDSMCKGPGASTSLGIQRRERKLNYCDQVSKREDRPKWALWPEKDFGCHWQKCCN